MRARYPVASERPMSYSRTLRLSTPSIRETGSESNGGKLRSTRIPAGVKSPRASAGFFARFCRREPTLPNRCPKRYGDAMRLKPSNESDEQEAPALANLLGSIALVGAFIAGARRPRKNSIRVRGGRARARGASRDERGRFLPALKK